MKRNLLLLLAILATAPLPAARSGWTWVNPPLYSVWAHGPDFMVAVGGNGLVAWWDGTDWTQERIPVEQHLYGVHGFGKDDVWAVGKDMIVHWDGESWAQYPQAPEIDLQDVWGCDPDSLWAVSEGGEVLHWDGECWEVAWTTPDSAGLRSVSGTSDSDLYVGGKGLFHWDGSGWDPIELQVDSSYPRILAMWSSPQGELVLGGDRWIAIWDGAVWSNPSIGGGLSDPSGALPRIEIISIWGEDTDDMFVLSRASYIQRIYHREGARWSQVMAGEADHLHALTGTQEGGLVAVGYDALRFDGGDPHSTAISMHSDVQSMYGFSVDDVTMLGSRGILHWDGSDLAILNDDFIDRLNGIHGRSFVDRRGRRQKELYAVGEGGLILRGCGDSWVEEESGTEWDLNAVWCDDSGIAFAVGGGLDYQGGTSTWHREMLRRDPSGWTRLTIEEGSELEDVWGFSADEVYVIGYREIARWDGSSLISMGSKMRSGEGIWGTDSNNIYAIGGERTSQHPRAAYRWLGNEWAKVELGYLEDTFHSDVWGSDESNVYLVGSHNLTFWDELPVCHWDGVSWTQYAPLDMEGHLHAVWGPDSDQVFMGGEDGLLFHDGVDEIPPLGVRLTIPEGLHNGTEFYVGGYLDNPGPPLPDSPVLFILESGGQFWFWPSWSRYDPGAPGSIDGRIMDIPHGTTAIAVVPASIVSGLEWDQPFLCRIWGAILSEDLTEIVGNHATTWFRWPWYGVNAHPGLLPCQVHR